MARHSAARARYRSGNPRRAHTSTSTSASASYWAAGCGGVDASMTQLFLATCQCAIPLGFIAVIAGWFVTEVGRQPWTIYGLLRTAASVSPSLTSHDVTLSLVAYMAVYLLIYPSGPIMRVRLVRKGPLETIESFPQIEAGIPAAPVLAPAINVVKGKV